MTYINAGHSALLVNRYRYINYIINLYQFNSKILKILWLIQEFTYKVILTN